MDYATLVENVAAWLNDRDDLKPVIPTFLRFAQEELENHLEVPDMTVRPGSTLYLTKGSNQITLPSDYFKLDYICFTDQLPSPVNATHTSGAGTLGAGTYYYRVSAVNSQGETLASPEASITLSVTGGVNVNWNKVAGATGYKVYGRSSGAERLLATVGDVSTWLDSGAATPADPIPTVNTSGTVRYRPLDRFVAKKFAEQSISLSGTGKPEVFTSIGNSMIFNRIADVDYAYEMVYFKRLPKLSNSNPLNWWSVNSEAAILYGALLQAGVFLGDDPKMTTWEKAYEKAFDSLKAAVNAEARSGAKTAWGGMNVFFAK